MKTSHFVDGAEGFVHFAATPCDRDFRGNPANDNRVTRGAPLPYARGVVLAMGMEYAGLDEAGIEAAEVPVVTLHLLLPDGEMGVAFHTARHDDDVIALWRGLGRDFGLPLYIRSLEGDLSALEPESGATGHARRTGSALSNRRPRFLARRRSPLKDHALTKAPRRVEIG
jgi:Family of unknown function (DUF6101)